MQKKEYSLEIGGKTMTAEFNDWANQANGSVLVRFGNSAVLATAVMGSKESNLDYFPLSVEYEEKFYAAGAILGSRFMRREGRPSDEATLSGRIVDRTIRPLFPKGLKYDIQVIITVLSLEDYDPDVLAVTAASLALGTSNIPWNGPASAVRIGLEEGKEEFVVNPTYLQRQEELPPKAKLDLLACGKDGLINMIEVGAREVDESTLEKAMRRASEEIEKIQAWQYSIIKERGVEKFIFNVSEASPEMIAAFDESLAPKIAATNGNIGKYELGAFKSEWIKAAVEKFPDTPVNQLDGYYEKRMDEYVHDLAIKEGKRVDGRRFDEIRPLYAQAGGVSPVIHGTGIFYRGETHVLAALTLGGPGDAQLVDTIEYQEAKKRFMLHYNFPPFSVGETGRVGGANRRMIGHGALAEKALRAVLPDKEVFPYTIRIVSECLASNGSTSQATICAGTLALMDAGVPITKPVAGIAMGMMSDSKAGVYKVLTDIQGPEDHHGDMDFKVAGTSEGVTAVQMDVKVDGVPLATLAEAFVQAKRARMEILDVITKEIAAPRADISSRAPKILTLKVKVDQIGLVIGPGGKTINGIREKTGAEDITIEEDGTVFVTGKNGSAEAAFKEISDLTREYMPGERFDGTVTRLMDFGAFVKIGPNTEGLVHVSEVAPFRIDKISDAVRMGDTVPVILKEIDEKGRYNLSIKAADPEWAEKKELNRVKVEETAMVDETHTSVPADGFNKSAQPEQTPPMPPGTASAEPEPVIIEEVVISPAPKKQTDTTTLLAPQAPITKPTPATSAGIPLASVAPPPMAPTPPPSIPQNLTPEPKTLKSTSEAAPPTAEFEKERESVARILEEVKLPERRSAPGETPGQNAQTVFDTKLGSSLTPEPVQTPSEPKKDETSEQVEPQNILESAIVTPLRTLKRDLQEIVQVKKISLVRAVALEQEKRRGRTETLEVAEGRAHRTRGILFSSALLLVLGGAALFGVYLVTPSSAQVPQDDSILFAENTVSLLLTSSSPFELKRLLSQARASGSATLGSITRVVPVVAETSPEGDSLERAASLAEFLKALGTRASDDLIRALGNDFFFGIHTVDENAPLFVIPVVSYERAFAGMLAWEDSLNADLSPAFTPLSPQVAGPGGLPEKRRFADVVMRNYDVRALKDDVGEIQLYYSFPTRALLVIGESPYSFTEILARLRAERKL